MRRQKAIGSINAHRKYLTQNKIRLILFTHSYASYRIAEVIKRKYKLDNKLTPQELRQKYFNKRKIPEVARLSRVLNLPYKPLWESLMLDKNLSLNKSVPDRNKIKVYLAIETELVVLAKARVSKLSEFYNPDYEQDMAILTTAIERTVGNKLKNIDNDLVFEHQQEILQKLYFRWYYKVAWKYKLPTMRIIPFILRLINF